MTNCVICTETLGDCPPLQCGHIVHLECLKKQFRPECPLCRAPLDIEVSGEAPPSYLGYESSNNESSHDEEKESSSDEEEESSRDEEEESSSDSKSTLDEYKDSYGQIWFNGHCIGDWVTQRTLVIERLVELEKKAKSLRESLEAIPDHRILEVRCEGRHQVDGNQCIRFIPKPVDLNEQPLCCQHKDRPGTTRCEARFWRQGQRQCSRFVPKPKDPDEKALCWQHKK